MERAVALAERLTYQRSRRTNDCSRAHAAGGERATRPEVQAITIACRCRRLRALWDVTADPAARPPCEPVAGLAERAERLRGGGACGGSARCRERRVSPLG